MANITVKEKQYLLTESETQRLYKDTDWNEDFADAVYKRTIWHLERAEKPLTFENFYESIVMDCFYDYVLSDLTTDMSAHPDEYVINEAETSMEYSDEVEDDLVIQTREDALHVLTLVTLSEQSHLVFDESKVFLDAVNIYVVDESEYNDEVDDSSCFNDPINVLFHSEGKTYYHQYSEDYGRRFRFEEYSEKELHSMRNRFIAKLDSKRQLSIAEGHGYF